MPFLAADFMGGGNREKRLADEQMSKVTAERANRKLSEITQHTKPEDIPELPMWAFGKAGPPNAR